MSNLGRALISVCLMHSRTLFRQCLIKIASVVLCMLMVAHLESLEMYVRDAIKRDLTLTVLSQLVVLFTTKE